MLLLLKVMRRSALLTIALCLVPAVAVAVLHDFQDQSPGLPPVVCGVSFINGGYAAYVWDSSVSPGAIGVRRNPSGDFFDAAPMEIVFGVPQSLVRMDVGHIDPAGTPVTGVLRAFDSFGNLVAGLMQPVGLGPTTAFELTRPIPNMVRVTLTFAEDDNSVGVLRSTEAIDNLELSEEAACDPDSDAPMINILWPPEGLLLNTDAVALVVEATDDTELWTVQWTIIHSDGSVIELLPGPGSVIPQPPGGQTSFTSGVPGPPAIPVIGGILESGTNTLFAGVCDTSNNCIFLPRQIYSTVPEDTLNFFLRAVEINQVTQDEISVNPVRSGIEFQDSYPGLPLIARKTTMVRVYPGSEGTSQSWLVPVRLYGTDAATGLDLPGSPLPAGLALVPPGDQFNPNSRAQGTVFVLPRSWTDAGSIELRAQVNPPAFSGPPGVPLCPLCVAQMNECVGCNDLGNLMRVVDVEFLDLGRPGMRIKPLPMVHTAVPGQIPTTLLPSNRAYLNNVFPLPDDPFLSPLGLQIDPDHPAITTSAANAAELYGDVWWANPIPASLNFNFYSFLGTIASIPSTFNFGGMGAIPGLYAWAQQAPLTTTAHEIGHNRNLVHSSTLHGETAGVNVATQTPFPHGGIGYAGFNASATGVSRIVPVPSATGHRHDFMSYGANRWVSPRTYVTLLSTLYGFGTTPPPDRFCQVGNWSDDCIEDPSDASPCTVCYTDADCPGGAPCVDLFDVWPSAAASSSSMAAIATATQVDGDFLVVAGALVDDSAALDRVYQLPFLGGPADPGTGSHRIEVRDASGTLVAERNFDPTTIPQDHEPLSPQATPALRFLELIPAPADFDTLTVLQGAQVLAEQSASSSVPNVQVASPNGGETWVPGEPGLISWTATDDDPGDSLTASVLVSLDAGVSWAPLAIGISASQFMAPADQISGSSQALVRVAVSDGLLASSDESDNVFEILPKPKSVEILSPLDHGVHDAAETLRVLGQARSLEKGPEPTPLGGEGLRFTATSIFGERPILMPGPEAEFALPSAIYDLTLTLIDPVTQQPLASDAERVWVSDARMDFEPSQTLDGRLQITGLLWAPPGAVLVGAGSAELIFELDDGPAERFAVDVELVAGANAFSAYQLLESGGAAELGTLSFDDSSGAWRLTLSLPAGILPPFTANTPDHARMMAKLGDRRYAGGLRIDRDGDFASDHEDNCPFLANAGQGDANLDGVGDACQCGDPNETGQYESADLLKAFNCLTDDPTATGKCRDTIFKGDANGTAAFESADLFAIFRALTGAIPGTSLTCPASQNPGGI